MGERLFKVLNADGTACHGGTLQWSLPNGQPGAWHEVTGVLEPCKRGLHLCREQDLVNWLGPTIYLAQADGERIDASDKVVVQRARLISKVETWTEQSARLFGVTCARRALERERAAGRDPDARSWHALAVATDFALGQATAQARAAARAAAGTAARAASGDAARDAAWAAARAAAWAATRAATRDAAWAAARAAARDAAGDAARAAARDAAWAAARDAAWAAERQWQTTELLRVLFPAERNA